MHRHSHIAQIMGSSPGTRAQGVRAEGQKVIEVPAVWSCEGSVDPIIARPATYASRKTRNEKRRDHAHASWARILASRLDDGTPQRTAHTPTPHRDRTVRAPRLTPQSSLPARLMPSWRMDKQQRRDCLLAPQRPTRTAIVHLTLREGIAMRVLPTRILNTSTRVPVP